MTEFENRNGRQVLLCMVRAIQENKEYLGDIDGLIGDGDHGMNMNKGFSMFEREYGGQDFTFTEGLERLGDTLFEKIGGSMGPIYGTFFMEMAEQGSGKQSFTVKDIYEMLDAGLKALQEIVEAQVGDKTLIDTLVPAAEALKNGAEEGKNLPEALKQMKTAAEKGMNSTKDMIARYGRSSRLGERSRGVLDAGAVSCFIILRAMAGGIMETLQA